MAKQKQAFTLVELIVVITILAILATITFISLSGYSQSARNSTRAADIKTIEKALQLYGTRNNIYPEAENAQIVSYSGETVYLQGLFGDAPYKEVGNLSNIPVDPLTKKQYIYSTTTNYSQYEILAIYEGYVVNNTILNQTYAAEAYVPKVTGTYNKILIKTDNYYIPLPSIINAEVTSATGIILDENNIKSQIVTNGTNLPQIGSSITQSLANLTINFKPYYGSITSTSTDEQKIELAQKIQEAYSGSDLQTQAIYSNILSKSGNSELVSIIESVVIGNGANNTVTQTTTTYSCTGTLPSQNVATYNITGLTADTAWQNTTLGDDCYYECTDGYTGTNCEIAPALITSTDCTNAGWIWVNETLDNQGNGFCISPRIESNADINGIAWQDVGTYYSWNNISYSTTEGYADNLYGVTAYLSNYTCDALGTAENDYDINDGNGDTIYNRMKWIASFSNANNNEIALSDIDWINITTNNTSFAIPAIYIADCIDGTKDLTTNMTLGAETITWSDYTSTLDTTTTRDNRNKYLLAWTNKIGSHLPSAYSDILYQIGDNLTGTSRGEYQVACDAGLFGVYSSINQSSTNDREAQELIWLSALGATDGANWGRNARIVGSSGCGLQMSNSTGNRLATRSARFVVRP
ncbi:MAG: prepilin-type N-terminal cleavage/methylation domain-containing protein [Candidatus Gracilibacteria bacterium]|nr:prepilin-type N-terminal cleavage/methylation domain-containing protein [Candidatus Gracilibacteria bacterium]